MTTRRLGRAVLLAPAACLALASAAPATQLPGRHREATFKVSVDGVQKTTWSVDHESVGLCDFAETGSGSETVRFSSRTVTIKAFQLLGRGPIYLSRAGGEAVLPGRGRVRRGGTVQKGPVDPSCAVGDGGDGSGPPPSDCGTKRITSLPLVLRYDGSKRITLANDGAKTSPDYENCPLMGEGWTSILSRLDHGTAGEDLPASDLFDRRQGKILVLGRGTLSRRGLGDMTSTTEIRWTLTLTRLRR
jgi:hypothetical protein